MNPYSSKIWHPKSAKPSFPRRWVKTLAATWITFARTKGSLHAASLTFYSLLSIIPLIAIVFGIAQGFGLQEQVQEQLQQQFASQSATQELLSLAERLLENTKGNILASAGLLFLLWTVLKLIAHIEMTLNTIWDVATPRSFSRKVTDYLAIALAAPLLLMLSGSLTIALQALLLSDSWQHLASTGAKALLVILPFLLSCTLFTFSHLFIPNTKIPFSTALFAGILSGTAYQGLQGIYLKFQVGIVKYNALYGSFAAIPLFILWLQISWLIFLGGAYLANAYKNAPHAILPPDPDLLSAKDKSLLALAILSYSLQATTPVSVDRLVKAFALPSQILVPSLHHLVNSGLVHEVYISPSAQPAYLPGTHSIDITISKACRALAVSIPQEHDLHPQLANLLAPFDIEHDENLKTTPVKNIAIFANLQGDCH